MLASRGVGKDHPEFRELYNWVSRGVGFALVGIWVSWIAFDESDPENASLAQGDAGTEVGEGGCEGDDCAAFGYVCPSRGCTGGFGASVGGCENG